MIVPGNGCLTKFALAPDNCTRLLTLSHRGEHPLAAVDHLCAGIAAASCTRWATAQGRAAGAAPGQPLGLNLLGRHYTHPIDPFRPPWPLPLAGGLFGLAAVLEQWVEAAEAGLIPLLEAAAGWVKAGERGARHRDWLAREMADWEKEARRAGDEGQLRGPRPAGVDPAAWAARPAAAAARWTENLAGSLLPDTGRLMAILRECHLPATPGTADYLAALLAPERYAKAQPGRRPCPTRGIRIVSFCLVPAVELADGKAGLLMDDSERSGQPDDALSRQAQRIGAQHRAWWGRVAPAPLPSWDLRQGNRRSPDRIGAEIERFLAGEAGYDYDTLKARTLAIARELGAPDEHLTPENHYRRLRNRLARLKKAREQKNSYR